MRRLWPSSGHNFYLSFRGAVREGPKRFRPQTPQRCKPPPYPSATGGVERPPEGVAAYQARLAAMGALVMMMLAKAAKVMRRVRPTITAGLNVVSYGCAGRAAWHRALVAITAQD